MKPIFVLLLSFISHFAFSQNDGCGDLLTEAAGLHVGCSLVEPDNPLDWYLNNLVVATFEKYRSSCPTYAYAVIEGYQNCLPNSEPVGGLTNPLPGTILQGGFQADCLWNGSAFICP